MSDDEPIASQFDAPWEIALESFLEPFMAFCFPGVHQLIDCGSERNGLVLRGLKKL